MPVQTILKNGDMVKILTSSNVSPSLHWLASSKTGKARAAIRRYWQGRNGYQSTKKKVYNTSLIIDLPHNPGVLGEISTLIGLNKSNIVNIELLKRKEDYLQFSFDIQIKDLKNFSLSCIKSRAFLLSISKDKSSNSSLILFIPILSANGA